MITRLRALYRRRDIDAYLITMALEVAVIVAALGVLVALH